MSRWAVAWAVMGVISLATSVHAATMFPEFPYRAKEFALVADSSSYHLFYMRHNKFVTDDATEKEFGHAISTDLTNWIQLPPVIAVRPGEWDNFHVWSPHIVRSGTDWAMFYTGVTQQAGVYVLFQRIGLATSPDLVDWTRAPAPVFGCPQVSWVDCDSSFASGGDFRDSFVMADPAQPGGWLMVYSTRPADPSDLTVLGLASSTGDVTAWTDRGPMKNTLAALVESPTMIDHDGLWYLFYTTNSGHPIQFQTSADPTADSALWSPQRRLANEVPDENSDVWFGPECFHIGGHDYFCAVNGDNDGIDIREIEWLDPPHFRLVQPTPIADVSPATIAGLTLRLAAAAPTGDRWRFEIGAARARPMRLEVCDVAGRRVRLLAQREIGAGVTSVEWDGRDETNQRCATGVYFVRLRSLGDSRAVRVAVLK